MACILVEVNKVDYTSLSDTEIDVKLLREHIYTTITALIRQKINCIITRADNAFQCVLSDVIKHPNVKVGIICSINNIPIPSPDITFKYDKITWDEKDNYAGAIKYNLLTASGEWRIEELL